MAAVAPLELTIIDQLYRHDGKAEIVGGRLIPLEMLGCWPACAVREILVSLRDHIRAEELSGIAVSGSAAFLVDLPNRRSFSPDVAYYVGPNSGMRFFEGAPRFAVEVRSENDYGFSAEEEMIAKRRDYFDAGTGVVWDVDLQSDEIVRKYTAESGANIPAVVFRRGDTADAELAVPGWTMPVDDLFE